MSTWTKQKFVNFAKLQRGFDLPEQDRIPGQYPVVASTSITAYHNEYKVKAPCVTTGRSGALGQVLYINEDCWPLNTALWVKDYYGNDPKFVYFKLKTLGLQKFNAGAGVPTLNKNHLDNIDLNIPDLPTQTRIASVLSAYDDLIENNEKRIKILEEMAERLYREWFVKFNFPGHEKVRLIDSGTEYGKIPEGWEVKRLDSEIELAYGKALKEDDRILGNVSVCGSGGIVGTHNEKLASGPGIVVGRKGNAGAVSWVNSNFWVIDTAYFVKTKLNLVFTYYLLKTQNFVLGDAAVPGLNREQAYRNSILVPPSDLIYRYAHRAEPLRELIGKIKIKNSNLSKTRDLLIPQLVTGKREVKN